jgi:hypothetical protein
VLLRLLGTESTRGRVFERADPSTISPERVLVPETGYSIGGPLLSFWQETGGVPVYGYPISEELQEVSPSDGQVYIVQYFERNRLEYHPEHAGTRHEVQLGLLGANLLGEGYWWR